jgi:hypothetical protein
MKNRGIGIIGEIAEIGVMGEIAELGEKIFNKS